MTLASSRFLRQLISALTAGRVPACASAVRQRDPVLASLWKDWERGDFAAVLGQAEHLAALARTADAGHFMLALASHVTGNHRAALAHHGRIAPSYPWLSRLDEPILWSYIHLRDPRGARAFAQTRAIGIRGATQARLDLAVERPLSVEIAGVVEVSFTDDALTPYMPGFSVRVNRRPAVARLDTGGSFIHLSSEQAAAFGIVTIGCETTFAALTLGEICYGIADLEIGSVQMRNVPVAVHRDVLPARAMFEAFGVELGPILGTNLLEQFLATIDAPGKRLLLSKRGDASARLEHVGRLGAQVEETPFARWHDHRMIVRGRVGPLEPVQLFVDSGLVAVSEQGQATLLAPRSTSKAWGASVPPPPNFADIPGEVGVGPASRRECTAFTIPDRTWREFGDWGGIKVVALLSWGFLKHFVWTIDFDRQIYMLAAPPLG